MTDDVQAKKLLLGVSMKIKAFYGTNSECAKAIDRFFSDMKVEFHDIKTERSIEKSVVHGDMLVIITYTEVK